uniref:Uncharacterized protein n=1 Tax=Tetraselmis sp. GSL018 TaxID=582737 RepID=A0A061RET4_9CHLO
MAAVGERRSQRLEGGRERAMLP